MYATFYLMCPNLCPRGFSLFLYVPQISAPSPAPRIASNSHLDDWK